MTKEIILKTQIKREQGFLYFVSTDENGCLVIGKTTMARGRRKEE